MNRRSSIRRGLLTMAAALGTVLSLGVVPATAAPASATVSPAVSPASAAAGTTGSWEQLPLPSTDKVRQVSTSGDAVFGYTQWNCGFPTWPVTCRQEWQLVNGAWSKVTVPAALANAPIRTTGTGAGDVWFLADALSGSGAAYHWDGQNWADRSLNLKGFQLADATAVSSTSVWTVGAFNTGYDYGQDVAAVTRWNGTGWTLTKLPAIAGNRTSLNSLSAASDNDIWASGDQCPRTSTGTGPCKPYVVHWNGTAWSQVAVPNFPADVLFPEIAARGGEVWVAGKETGSNGATSDRVFAMRWDGQSWNKSYLPVNTGGDYQYSEVNGLLFHGTSLFVAVSGTTNEGLVRWDGQSWAPYTGPLATTSTVISMAGTSDGRLVVAGNGSDATGSRAFVAALPSSVQ
ncbi:hypothetical protein ACFQ6N_16190 [Kitasatospora sp. NPDC056446]|uniref:hypothetical protein n=1 Tax=Kitasatospora sp. NPDC056446 TaxID=3345819 RepID=UPI0036AB88EA